MELNILRSITYKPPLKVAIIDGITVVDRLHTDSAKVIGKEGRIRSELESEVIALLHPIAQGNLESGRASVAAGDQEHRYDEKAETESPKASHKNILSIHAISSR